MLAYILTNNCSMRIYTVAWGSILWNCRVRVTASCTINTQPMSTQPLMCELWSYIPTTRCPFTHPASYSYAGIINNHLFSSTFSNAYIHVYLTQTLLMFFDNFINPAMNTKWKPHHCFPFPPPFHSPNPEVVQSCNNLFSTQKNRVNTLF